MTKHSEEEMKKKFDAFLSKFHKFCEEHPTVQAGFPEERENRKRQDG